MPHLTTPIPAGVHHPGAQPGCAVCAGTGWRLEGDPVVASLCSCAQTCPRCQGGGFLAGGLETCACRQARERVELLSRASLPAWSAGPLVPGALADWFGSYRPESGRAWLLVHGPDRAATLPWIARLIASIGVPAHRADRSPPSAWSRVVLALELDGWEIAAATRLVDIAEQRELTLIATSALPPYPSDGPGLEATVGDRAAIALLEHAQIIGLPGPA